MTTIPTDHRKKQKESEKRTEKTKKHESKSDINWNWCARYKHKRACTETGRLGNKRTSEDHSSNSIIEISQNTEKGPGDLLNLRLQGKTIS